MEVRVDDRCREKLCPEGSPDVLSPSERELAVDTLVQLALFVLQEEDAPQNAELSLSFVDTDEMAALNERYRGKEGPTDVLSFECDDPWDEGNEAATIVIGDIVIAPFIAARQAPEYSASFSEEMELLVTHGVLHLLGYDHIQELEAQTMEARERALLALWRVR